MKKQAKKLVLTKETMRSLDGFLPEWVVVGGNTVGPNTACQSLCVASRYLACISPQTGG